MSLDVGAPFDTAAIVKGLYEDGFYVAKGVVSEALCDQLLESIEYVDKTLGVQPVMQDQGGPQSKRFYDVLNYDKLWERVPTHPAIISVARELLGEDCLLNSLGTNMLGPQERAQHTHADDSMFIRHQNTSLLTRAHDGPGGARVPIILNTIVALQDFTAENGATHFLPGSHKLGYPNNGAMDSKSTAALMKARGVRAIAPKGSVIFWNGEVYHGSGDNNTDRDRYAVICSFCCGLLRSQENFMLSLGEEKAAGFSEDLQKLIGYQIGASGLGQVFAHRPRPMVAKVVAKAGETRIGRKGLSESSKRVALAKL